MQANPQQLERGKSLMTTQLRPSQRMITDTIEDIRKRTIEWAPTDRRARIDAMEFQITSDPNSPMRQFSLVPMKLEGEKSTLPDSIELSPLAYSQFMEKVRFPVDLANRLPARAVYLDVNWLMQKEMDEKEGLLRLIKGNTARALLSTKYTPLDDFEVLDAVQEHATGAIVRYEALEETSTHISITWPGKDAMGLERGIRLRNSEVGLGAVTIQTIVFREACYNVLPYQAGSGFGEVAGQSYTGQDGTRYIAAQTRSKNQRGLKVGTYQDHWRYVHVGDHSKLIGFVKDAIEDSQRQYDVLTARWSAGLEQAIKDPIGLIERTAKDYKHTKEELRTLLDAWADTKNDFGANLTGVVNAFTLASQKAPNADARYYMQNTGSALLMSGVQN